MITPPNKSPNPARRHFLALAAAAGTRVAAATAMVGVLGSGVARAGKHGPRRGSDPTGYRGGGGNNRGPQCFFRGTRILTDIGEAPVETLSAGDTVIDAEGRPRQVRWVARTAYRHTGRDWHEDIRPIRFRRSSIAEGVPSRDLYLSPWHFVHFDGLLMPARDLVNDVSIVAEAPTGVTRLDYYHILLDEHALLLAEGVEAESLLLKAGEHEHFTNFVEFERLGLGTEFAGDMESCLPRVWYSGGRSHLVALGRLGISTVVDIRDPIQRVNARLARRAPALPAA